MARNISDKDIVEALTGTGSTDNRVVEALHGSSLEKRRSDAAVLEALTGRSVPVVVEGELPLQRRGDDLEAVAIWASKEATSRATSTLAEALMRTDPRKGIYAAESEAKAIAAEAYAESAKSIPFEDTRQAHVQKFVTKLAENLNRPRQKPAAAPARPVTTKPAATTESAPAGLTKQVTISKMTGMPITHYSRTK